MNTLPKDFAPVLDGVWSDIKNGKLKADSSEALGEAWRRWRAKHGQRERTVQQRRYAYRKSFENPADVRIIHNKLLGGWYVVRGPHQTPISGRFDTKADALAWLNRKNPRKTKLIQHDYKHTGSGKCWLCGKPASSHRNPGARWHLDQATKAHLKAKRAPDKEERDHQIGHFEAELEAARTSRKMGLNPASTERQRKFMGAELRRKRQGERTVTGMSEQELRKFARKNPIAIYNPNPGLRLLYGRAFIPKIYGKKTSGPNKGKEFVHDFKSDVKVYGLPQGGLMIQSLDGSRLWADERDLDKYERK